MRLSNTRPGSKVVRWLAPVALVAGLGIGAAACGSSGKSTPSTGNGPAPASNSTPASNSPTTNAPSSGGAGF